MSLSPNGRGTAAAAAAFSGAGTNRRRRKPDSDEDSDASDLDPDPAPRPSHRRQGQKASCQPPAVATLISPAGHATATAAAATASRSRSSKAARLSASAPVAAAGPTRGGQGHGPRMHRKVKSTKPGRNCPPIVSSTELVQGHLFWVSNYTVMSYLTDKSIYSHSHSPCSMTEEGCSEATASEEEDSEPGPLRHFGIRGRQVSLAEQRVHIHAPKEVRPSQGSFPSIQVALLGRIMCHGPKPHPFTHPFRAEYTRRFSPGRGSSMPRCRRQQ